MWLNISKHVTEIHNGYRQLTKLNQLNYLPCIMYCCLPVSVSCPVYRNVDDEECLPLASVSKGMHVSIGVHNDVHMNQKRRRLPIMSENFPLIIRYELGLFVGWLVDCLTSQQQASVSQGRICLTSQQQASVSQGRICLTSQQQASVSQGRICLTSQQQASVSQGRICLTSRQ